MVKIVLVGAGSAVFGKNILADILAYPELAHAHLALVDIDAERLDTARRMAVAINAALGARATVTTAGHWRQVLKGADFVINTMGVGGLPATRLDLKVPRRYGLNQTIGDTLGIGGIFRAARSIPVLLRLCADIERLCPRALLLNYTNPMAMHCLAMRRATRVRHVGLCHGVRHTAQTMRMLTAMADVSPAAIARHFKRPWNSPLRNREWREWVARGNDPRLSYLCAGINHMAFFLRFESAGEDLYPQLRKAAESPHLVRLDPVRFELLRWLKYFMTEASGHTAEYVPWFLKSRAEIAARSLWVSSYLRTCRDLNVEYRQLRRALRAGRPVISVPYAPSVEYAGPIVLACVTHRPFVFNGNVANDDAALIANLPADACVEVPCVADRNGITPTRVGALPPQCAALIRTNVNVQDLAVRGIVEGDRAYLYQAAMLDPNTAASLTLPQIRKVCDAMFQAHTKRKG